MQDTPFRLNRRAFALGSAALALGARMPAFAATPDAPRLILCDRRHAARLTIADRQLPVVLFDGDLTKAWIDRIQPLWSEGPAVIAGIASSAALFCLEHLARGERHRLVSRVALSASSAVRFRFAPVGRGVI